MNRLSSNSLALCLGALLAAGCLHAPIAGPDELKKAADNFHKGVRWKDYGAAVEYVVPERREAFLEARKSQNDEKNLSVSDYQLDELTIEAGGKTARVRSHLSWFRFPSLNEETVQLTSEFVLVGGSWLLARQTGGPFADTLSAPYQPPDAGS